MMMIDSSQQELVLEIARDTVARLSPAELPLFNASSQAFFKDPDAIQAGGNDQMIGFGVGEAAGMLTPAVLAVTLEVVRSVVDQLKETLKTEGGNLTSDWVRLLFNKYRPAQPPAGDTGEVGANAVAASQPAGPPPVLPAPLTAQQLATVRRVALKKARQLKLSDANAAMLADAIVGGLAVT